MISKAYLGKSLCLKHFDLIIEYLKSITFFIKRRFIPVFLKILPLLIILFVNILWIIADDTTPLWDESRHTINSIRILEAIKNPEKFSLTDGLIWFYDFYTHLSYIIAALFHIIFGMSYDSACLHLSLFWIPLLYFSIYGISKIILSRNNSVPTITALISISFPIVLGIGKVFLLDIPALAITAFTFYIIIKTNFLLAKGSWKWVTIAIVLAFFTKTNSLVFLVWFFLIGFARGIHKALVIRSIDLKNFLNNYLIALTLSFTIIFIWILPNMGSFFTDLRQVSYQAGINEGDPYPFSWRSITYYPLAFLNEYLLLPLFLFFCFGTYQLIRNRDHKTLLLLGYFIIPYLYLTFFHYNKDSRYLIPILVTVSMIIAYPLSVKKIKKPIKIMITTSLLIIFLWNVITTNFGELLKIPTLNVLGIEVSKNSAHIASSPKRGLEYNSPEFVSKLIGLITEIKRLEGDNTTTSVFIDIRNSALLSYASIAMYSMINKTVFYGLRKEDKKDPDIMILSEEKLNESDTSEMVKIYEKEIPGDKFIVLLHRKLKNWLIFFDPILKNAIGMKITNVSYKDGNIIIDFLWVCKNRNYGDIIATIDLYENSTRIITLSKEHLIPQGGDGGTFIRSIIEVPKLKPGNYNIQIGLTTTYLKDIYHIIPIIFGPKKFEDLKKHVQINSIPITLNIK